jgi:hypothetical protein
MGTCGTETHGVVLVESVPGQGGNSCCEQQGGLDTSGDEHVDRESLEAVKGAEDVWMI